MGDHAAEMASYNEHRRGEGNAACVYTGTRAHTKAPAHRQHSVDLLILSNMAPAETQSRGKIIRSQLTDLLWGWGETSF